MPTFYEGEPIVVLRQQLTQEEYARAFSLSQRGLKPTGRREFKAAVCLCLAAVIGSLIPLYYSWFYSAWMPALGIGAALIFAVFFYVVMPKNIASWGCELYSSSLLLQREETVSVYRDSIELKNGMETFMEYYTSYQACLENPEFIVLLGGRERLFLMLKKSGLSPQEQEALTVHFSNEFARRYHRFSR